MAGDVIDALVVELKLDPTQYKKGLTDALAAAAKGKEQLRRDASDIESGTKQMSEVFSKLRTNLLGMAALLTGGLGLKEFISQTVQTDMHIGRLSKVVGVSAETLSTWRNAGILAGGSGESFSNVLKTITLEMAKLQLTGESQIIPFFRALGVSLTDDVGKFKNATQLFLDIADAIQQRHVDPARATLILQSMGADEATVNAVLKGRDALKAYLDQAQRVGTVTAEDTKAAEALNTSWNKLLLTSGNLGRTILTDLTPALVGAMNAITNFVSGAKERLSYSIDTTSGKISPWAFDLAATLGRPFQRTEANTQGGSTFADRFGFAGGGGNLDVESYIREAARRRGIDPEIALKVARSEGLNGYVGDRGSSFGPYQLHYGGVASGGMATGGLGDAFTKKTGLDARDKSTVREQVDFALDYASKNGWSAWHGWRGAPFAGIGAGAAVAAAASVDNSRTSSSTSSSETKIGTLVVNSQSKDAAGIAKDIHGALTSNSFAINANQGQQ